MKRIIAGIITTLLFSAVSAFAAEPGLYVNVNVGPSYGSDSNYKDSNPASGPAAVVKYDIGFVGGIAIGHDYGNNVRSEIEAVYHTEMARSINISGVGTVNYGSTVSSISGLVNGYYDIKQATLFGVSPFVAAGIGIADVSIGNGYVVGSKAVNSTDSVVFAYQVSAGASYQITPKIAAQVGYRYFATSNAEFKFTNGGGGKAEYATNDVLFGLRYKF
ncbi:MAG: acyloxyacyl hydrolase [Oryzomonas sp.]|jgi:opacity protein-like surface antigen